MTAENSSACVTPNQRYITSFDAVNKSNSGDPIGDSRSCQGVWSWKFTRLSCIQLAYFFVSPFTMGSIWRQSCQVPAKNSINIKSFWFGTATEEEIGVEGETAAGRIRGAGREETWGAQAVAKKKNTRIRTGNLILIKLLFSNKHRRHVN